MRYWLGAAALAVVIFVLSSLPADDLGPKGIWRFDKLVHAATWSLLAAQLAAGATVRGWRARAAYALAIALGVVYGAIDEIHQSFTPGRDASVADAVADTVGAVVGALAGVWFARWRSSGPTRASDPASASASSSPTPPR